ncbi:MAG: hypothetical protein HC784_18445 [Hydrococcus sp. CSU_1_8]|nr:hypothetical protein [Hydrococcus sp. CSU_1_8]
MSQEAQHEPSSAGRVRHPELMAARRSKKIKDLLPKSMICDRCNDENFWRNRLLNTFPEFKSKNNWKEDYLKNFEFHNFIF